MGTGGCSIWVIYDICKMHFPIIESEISQKLHAMNFNLCGKQIRINVIYNPFLLTWDIHSRTRKFINYGHFNFLRGLNIYIKVSSMLYIVYLNSMYSVTQVHEWVNISRDSLGVSFCITSALIGLIFVFCNGPVNLFGTSILNRISYIRFIMGAKNELSNMTSQ